MMRFFVSSVLSYAAFAAAVMAGAQAISTLRVTTRLVEVPATVTDGHGHYLDTLKQEDFHLSENGRPQTIKYFANNEDSLTCAILLDTTGSMEKALPRLKNSVLRFIDELGVKDSVGIYSFAETLEEQQEFTKDRAAAKRSVLKLHAGGRTALFDALTDVTRDLAKRPGKKAVVVFTDGDDNASILTAQAAVGRATKNGVPLFSIAEGEATQSPRLKKILTDLSKDTGGQSFEVKDMKDLEAIFLRISSVLQHMYLITYQPPLEPDDGKWRTIEVTVGQEEKYKVLAKEGYFSR